MDELVNEAKAAPRHTYYVSPSMPSFGPDKFSFSFSMRGKLNEVGSK